MVLSYHYPLRILLGIIIAAAVAAVAYYLKKRNKKGKPLRVANSARLKSHPLYKKALMQSRVFRILSTAGIILSLTAALFLSARPYRRSAFKENVNRRDIFLCIDLSPSNYRGVKDLVNEFSHVVEGLDGDRIGISVFNTSSVRYVPMTDDYDFALERLEALAGYLAAEEEFTTKYVDRYDSVYDILREGTLKAQETTNRTLDRVRKAMLSTFDKGTTAGYEVKGTSAVGEGLASCLFSFPELSKEERTRAIILVTDNHEELFDDPLVTLEESAQMCAQNKVTVFGIYPGDSQASAGSAADGQSGSGVDGEAPSSPGQTGGSGQGSNDGSPGSGSYSASDSASDRNRMKRHSYRVGRHGYALFLVLRPDHRVRPHRGHNPLFCPAQGHPQGIIVTETDGRHPACPDDGRHRGHRNTAHVSESLRGADDGQSGRGFRRRHHHQYVGGGPRRRDPHRRREKGYLQDHEFPARIQLFCHPLC